MRPKIKSGRRDSNPRQPAWEAGTLPTELRPHSPTNIGLTSTNVKGKFTKILFLFFNKRNTAIIYR